MDNSLNPSELLLLVDEAIGIPDGIINCVELNRLLKMLAEDVTNGRQESENQRLIQEDRLKALEEALAEVNEAMDQFEDLQPNVQEGAAETRRDDEKSKEVESGLEETEDVAEDQYNDEQMKVVESTSDDKQEVTEKEQVNEVLEESVGTRVCQLRFIAATIRVEVRPVHLKCTRGAPGDHTLVPVNRDLLRLLGCCRADRDQCDRGTVKNGTLYELNCQRLTVVTR
ncbi:hypothetical protein ZHAS_00020202 [Anopheles sinensis]|uniref:Uncharacterized protein n=1 Tax=Anopheles sinensis TaxID=74873 RepID=A0A084WP68_ANOSI|nr:hypothetical protein ZHAS_00020202 [Anopheles sinensis]